MTITDENSSMKNKAPISKVKSYECEKCLNLVLDNMLVLQHFTLLSVYGLAGNSECMAQHCDCV